MAMTPSSTAQAARQGIAARLRELRLDAGLNGQQLSSRCGWSPAKTSRLEAAKHLPSDADIRAWCEACGAGDESDELVAASRTADEMYVEWRRKERTGLRRLQESTVPLYRRTRRFRTYATGVIPGLVQTERYAAALLDAIAEFRGIRNDAQEAARSRVARSQVMRRRGTVTALLMEEDALHQGFGGPDVLVEQLDYLVEVMALPNVSLGVIPRQVARRMWPVETFMIFDEDRAGVELLSADVTITAPAELTLYLRAFASLSRCAVYGNEARALIDQAARALSAD
ncbi:helix-turn-helix domain-containing protein [Streptomyces sp. XC 2026]|nr:helix-turn-helix domain-containing protein [Streptomyces sp. XC 2026]